MPAISGSQRFIRYGVANVMRAGASRAYTFNPNIRVNVGGTTVRIDKARSSIRLAEGERPSTATIVIPDRSSTLNSIPAATTIAIYGGTTASPEYLFSGKAHLVSRDQVRIGEKPTLTYECADWRALLETRLVRYDTEGSWSANSLVDRLLYHFGPTSVSWDVTEIASDVGAIESTEFINTTLLEAINRIFVRLGARWWVRGNNATCWIVAEVAANSLRGRAHNILPSSVHYWGLDVVEDWSQVRNRVFVEGASVHPVTRVADFMDAAPIETVPDWYETSAGSLTLRVRTGVLDGAYIQDYSNFGQVVASVSANVAIGANTIQVSGLSTRMTNPPSWVRIDEQWIYFQNRNVIGSYIYTINAATLTGGISQSITAGAAVYDPVVMSWTANSWFSGMNPSDPMAIMVTRTNDAARSLAITREGGDGWRDHLIQDGRLSVPGAIQRAEAEVEMFGYPEYRGSYFTRDPNATIGQDIVVHVSSPSPVSSVTARIVDVELVRLEDSSNPGAYTYPVRKVQFSSHRYRDIFQAIRDLETRNASR